MNLVRDEAAPGGHTVRDLLGGRLDRLINARIDAILRARLGEEAPATAEE